MALLPTLRLLTQRGFYLAGGTGLALQLAHRRSVDFDFYRREDFDPQRLHQALAARVREARLVRTGDGTLIVRLNGVECSGFRYAYPLLKPLVTNDYLAVASLEDIAAMKLAAVIQRGTRRDYVDLFVLIERFGLKQLLGLARKKYKGFNEYVALQALTYFEDAERDPQPARLRLTTPLDWEDVKRGIERHVRTFIAEAS